MYRNGNGNGIPNGSSNQRHEPSAVNNSSNNAQFYNNGAATGYPAPQNQNPVQRPPQQSSKQTVIPPYPTVPYPGFIDYHTTNLSTGSLTHINQRADSSVPQIASSMKNSTTVSSFASFESIPKAPNRQPSLPPKIPLDQSDYIRNNSIQSSYSIESNSTYNSSHTSSSNKYNTEPETIRSFEEEQDNMPPPPSYDDVTQSPNPNNYPNEKQSQPQTSSKPKLKMSQQLDRLSDELQQFQVDGGLITSPSRVHAPETLSSPVDKVEQHQAMRRKAPPQEPIIKNQGPAQIQSPPRNLPQQQNIPQESLNSNIPTYSDEISPINFNKIKDYAIADFKNGNFTALPQLNWIKTMFQYSSDSEFMREYNINGERLTRPLSPNEVKKNEQIFVKQAVKLLKKVVHVTKDPEAQYITACLYSNSPSIKVPYPTILDKNFDKSFEYYLKSANQGHEKAMYRLGVTYEIGLGTQQNDSKALECFIRSAEFGSVSSMFKLGMIYSRGALNSERSASRSLYWLNRAAELATLENPHSLFELAKYYEYDFTFLKNETLTQSDAKFLKELQTLNINKDERVALQYYKEAAKLTYAPAQCKLGWCYEYGKLGCTIDPRRSIGWYSRAAKQGSFAAEMALSGWYLTGAKGILEPNDKEAFLWARKSAESGFDKAEYALGYYYEVGLGVQADPELSRKFYLKAATQGHDKAIAKLREGRSRGH
ncbi:Activator of C kinase protein 1 [Wickerhamomyces ciferrii]|uniref:Activator of C kinase protein 1 n=1 Tax=Wickerhamomyces ciferrii (strain ATCC 14091 / BCRC 22168 / CBS 111 / JCM 3599 / NBRC 0793 / NRRL Y-1031 F-60-10) TaxID=1206466 RepID=K0KP81_WICCF|nr:Activator of C kinase protein 1 [Wickerhamomyces ciferrii]CCH42933.1 Activator of C kinase protein 1 [Wickerhamomyces ciferrii]